MSRSSFLTDRGFIRLPGLLDTNIVVHLRERNAPIMQRFDDLDERPFISVATRVELEGGVYAHREWRDMRCEAVDTLLAMLPQLEFNEVMAEAYGRIISRSGSVAAR